MLTRVFKKMFYSLDSEEIRNEFILPHITSFQIGKNRYNMSINSDEVTVEKINEKKNICKFIKPKNNFEKAIKNRLVANLEKSRLL